MPYSCRTACISCLTVPIWLLTDSFGGWWISVLTLFPAGVLAQCPSPGPSLLADFSPCLLRGPVDGCLIAFLKRIQDRTNSHWNVHSSKGNMSGVYWHSQCSCPNILYSSPVSASAAPPRQIAVSPPWSAVLQASCGAPPAAAPSAAAPSPPSPATGSF